MAAITKELKLQHYEQYKNSGVEWLGKIPKHWEMVKLFYLFRAEKGKQAGKLTKEFCGNFKGIYPVYSGQTENNGIMSSINYYEFDFDDDGCIFTTTVGAKAMSVSYLKGKFSLSQNCMIITKRKDELLIKFYYHHLQPFFSYFRNQIPEHMQASFRMDDLYKMKICLPPLKEQTLIAKFLDDKTAKIDQAISIKQKQIDLLKERRQILIHKAVTKGINPNVKLKDSGVDWIGEIPEDWEFKRLKYVFRILKRISGELGHKVLSITQTGIKVKDTESGEGQLSMDYSKYQFVYKGDFAMNHMDLLTGYVDISKFDGVTSPDYRVFDLTEKNSNGDYMLLLLQLCYNNKVFYAHGQGVSMFGRWRFPSENFNNFYFPIPPKIEQIEIVKFIDNTTNKISNAIFLKEKEIEKLTEYKTSLINSVVTGKVKVS